MYMGACPVTYSIQPYYHNRQMSLRCLDYLLSFTEHLNSSAFIDLNFHCCEKSSCLRCQSQLQLGQRHAIVIPPLYTLFADHVVSRPGPACPLEFIEASSIPPVIAIETICQALLDIGNKSRQTRPIQPTLANNSLDTRSTRNQCSIEHSPSQHRYPSALRPRRSSLLQNQTHHRRRPRIPHLLQDRPQKCLSQLPRLSPSPCHPRPSGLPPCLPAAQDIFPYRTIKQCSASPGQTSHWPRPRPIPARPPRSP